MGRKASLEEATTYAITELKAANIRLGRVRHSEATGTVSLDVERAFSICGSINVSFYPDSTCSRFEPRVMVNFPACNKTILEASAFAALVNELAPLAASLQVELDELDISTGVEAKRVKAK